MSARVFRLMLIVFLAGLWAAAPVDTAAAAGKTTKKAKAKASNEEADADPNRRLPWTLREHYTITSDKASLIMAADNGEWRLECEGIGTVVDTATAKAYLADGTVISADDIRHGSGLVKRFSEDYGEGMVYTVDSEPMNGLAFRFTLNVPKERPFYLLRVEVVNRSAAPIEVARIDPGWFTITGLSASTVVGQRNLKARGPYLVPAGGGGATMAVFQDAAHGFTLAMGNLSMRQADFSMNIQPSGASWQAVVSSVFSPAIKLEPGQSLSSDPMWLLTSVPKAADVDQLYAWTHSLRPKANYGKRMPEAWATASDGASSTDVTGVAGSWSGSGIDCILVPPNWQSMPGSLEGSRPNYPHDMGSLASSLLGMDMKPGLSIDPLAIQGGSPEWSAKTADGQTWLDPTNEAGRKAWAAQLREKMGKWGYEFFVVAPTSMPDEALKQFNATRVQADACAFLLMAEAFPGVPVLPSPLATLPADLNTWLAASSSTSRFEEYGVTCGPVAFDAAKAGKLDDALLTAMLFYGGPVEVQGECGAALRKQLAATHPSGHFVARPLAFEAAPGAWLVSAQRGQTSEIAEGVALFPGASEASTAAMNASGNTTIWHAEKGEVLQIAPKAPAAMQMAKRNNKKNEAPAPAEEQVEPEKAAEPAPAPAEAPAAAPALAAQPAPQPVPAPAVAVAQTPPAPPAMIKQTVEIQHIVKSGDTLSNIAKKYQVAVADLRTWNSIKGDIIKVNQNLRIVKEEEVPAPPPPVVEPAPAPEPQPAPPAEPAAAPEKQKEEKKGWFKKLLGKDKDKNKDKE